MIHYDVHYMYNLNISFVYFESNPETIYLLLYKIVIKW